LVAILGDSFKLKVTTTMGLIFIIFILLFYVLHTLSYAIYFSKTSKNLFDKKQRRFHLIMMWLIPFFWIAHLKTKINQLNSYGNSKKQTESDYSNFSDNNAIWINDFYNFFHSNTTSHSTSNTSFDSDIHHSQGHANDSFDSSGHHGDSTDISSGHH
jgi:hypothetical protein